MDMNVSMLKKFLFGAVLLMALLPVTNSYADDGQDVCLTSGGAVVFPGSHGCVYEPTTYSLTVYELGLCTSFPDAPTTTSAAGLLSCTTVYENNAGIVVSVSSTDPPVALSGGTVTVPPAGDYGFGYVLLSNTISVATSVTFSEEQTGQAIGSDTGPVCWTVEGEQSSLLDPPTSECGDSVESVGTMNILVDGFDELGDYEAADDLGTAGFLNAYILNGDKLAENAVVDGETVPGPSDHIFAVQTFEVLVTVPAEPTSLDVAFKSSTALGITPDNGEVRFSGGPFSVKITVE